MKDRNWVVILPILFYVLAGFGYIRCAYKMFTCNWEPIGKAEVIYTVSAFTPLGCVVGLFDIKDK